MTMELYMQYRMQKHEKEHPECKRDRVELYVDFAEEYKAIFREAKVELIYENKSNRLL
jgi:hypothetical protein